ncbi:MAG TPA: extracellular solute-binding protein, partial [Chloroflexota bacterium]|nr:extracellular solute-binding protein [Chloroflexota bacterium]
RRSMIASTGAGGAALVLAACGTPTSSSQPQTQTQQAATIRVIARTGAEADMWPIRVPQLEQAHPNIKINLELIAGTDGGGVQVKTDTFLAAGEVLDIVHTHFSAAQPQRLYLNKSMRELDSFIAKDKVDLKQWYPQALEAGRVDGKVIALPFKGKMATVALHINQSLFEAGGVKLPDLNTTLNDLTDMAVKLTKPDGSQWGIVGFMPAGARNITGTFRRWNAELFDKDQKRATLDSSAASAAAAWYYDILHRRKAATFTDDQNLFRQGKAAMLIHRDYNEKTTFFPAAQQQGFKYTATLIPKGPSGRRGGVWIPDGMQIGTASKAPDQAWTTLKRFTDYNTGLALGLQKSAGVSTTPGARPDVYNDPKFINHEIYPKVFQELDRDSNQLPENYQGSVPANYKIPEGDAVLTKAMTAVQKGEVEPTPSFMKNLNDEVQNILNMPR